MENQETPRQMKINTVIQHEIAYLIQDAIRKSNTPNLMVSVTKVKVVPDISIAKVYISLMYNFLYQSLLYVRCYFFSTS